MKAELQDRIVAIVNDEIILYSEFSKELKIAREFDADVTGEDVLQEMINQLLILDKARKFRITTSAYGQSRAKDEQSIIKEYIDVRLRGFIHVPYEDIEYYYYQNEDSYSGKELYDVRDEIEDYLIERELSIKLLEYVEELKRNSYIRIQLNVDS
ncbi:MAG: hypothetical protein JSW20_00935 [Nitrospiraceae bacterium]|nr:MAG: hypothetical protein JSW20_00935 [Nitrospiraceae bacterium]